jgi:hypothetical protein
MKPPTNTELFEGPLGTYWFDEDGILYSASKSPRRTIENVTANIELVKRISKNKPVCLIVYLSKSSKPDKQTRDYVAKELPNVYKAMAMVSKSGLGRFIMNFIFGLNKPSIPMKTFSDDKKAKEWLMQYR